ncbi:PPK2 family polyphosphate kinase [Pseudoduganella namucuonensis]|uniref:Polyphosphate:nucleotide phosphotransferase, PPK2 family n=1 Tax=Pseudoduganella namucuonensis TaxID=1035707 RepID=A0A1I7GA18_9BURK|nr:PPK2 family polyphosphate kinase [Pseudoduganella namucuonensis]SFU45116.1 polyphosphate:nucleotide phosphotransferase, PPK2 family [Pseudoduganella namucuonensis]
MKATALLRAPSKLKLRESDAARRPLDDGDKAAVKDRTEKLLERVAELQPMLHAQRRHKVLLVLQGMDASGKDGAIRTLFGQINPVGIRAEWFQAPTAVEAAHDYLWRVHRKVPGLGELTVFNRSHYEDVLVARVLGTVDAREAGRRLAQIRDFERMLAETGTTILKVFLHISKDEQRERLQARIDDPEKQWKFDPSDIAQRAKWNTFQRLYEEVIAATDADHAPWYVVPADSKPHRDLAIAALLLETLKGLKPRWPKPHPMVKDLKIR